MIAFLRRDKLALGAVVLIALGILLNAGQMLAGEGATLQYIGSAMSMSAMVIVVVSRYLAGPTPSGRA